LTIIFPILIWVGASGNTTDKRSTKIFKFLGDISFPVYIIHYPIMYLFYSWLIENKLYTLGETWPVAILVMIGSIIIAYLCLKLYDEPIRKWLSKKFILK
jgi:peptidoglycan/LPS O-acetylase OafA/YrhL